MGQVKIILLEDVAQFTKVFDDQVRFSAAQLIESIIASQHGTGMNASVFSGLDVVLHVTDEEGFFGLETIINQDLMDFLALVPDTGIRPIEILAETRGAFLDGKMIWRNGAQQKCANFSPAAKL